nr:vacuolar calcium ion transporter [Quercus suber]
MGQVKVVLLSWVNILLVAVPAGFALNYALGDSRTEQIIIFVVNFIAIIPLAGMLSFATEELALYVGETLGGLLNASFGNAVELIVGVISLNQNQITIVQTSLVGSMLSNLLLVLGMCFFFGGLKRTEQFFNITVAQTAASLLALAIGSLVIPTAFAIFTQDQGVTASADGIIYGVSQASRGTAVMLLFIYACYLIFQLKTHVVMYNEPSQKVPKKKSGKKDAGEALKGIAVMGAGTGAAASGGKINQDNLVHEEEEEEETPSLTMIGALVTLAGSTVLVAFCAEFMVSAIDAVSESGVSKEFVGLILLPIVGNAAEHATAVTVAIKDKMDLAIGVAVGSSLQIALLVLPLMVLLSWFGVGQNVLSLDFDGFQVSVLFISIILVNYLIQDGKSHWLEGIMLNITYLIIALAAWFYPAPDDTRMANTAWWRLGVKGSPAFLPRGSDWKSLGGSGGQVSISDNNSNEISFLAVRDKIIRSEDENSAHYHFEKGSLGLKHHPMYSLSSERYYNENETLPEFGAARCCCNLYIHGQISRCPGSVHSVKHCSTSSPRLEIYDQTKT